MNRVTAIAGSLAAALAMGAVSTAGDLIWALWIPTHRAVLGLIHGALLCMCLGVVLGLLAATGSGGAAARSAARGAAQALFIGLAAAASFYAMSPLIGWRAMFVAWMGLWIMTAFLNRRLRGSRENLGVALARGTVAAVTSGLAFYTISGIWLSPSPGGPSYAYNFFAWTIAFLPGFLALLVGQAPAPEPSDTLSESGSGQAAPPTPSSDGTGEEGTG